MPSGMTVRIPARAASAKAAWRSSTLHLRTHAKCVQRCKPWCKAAHAARAQGKTGKMSSSDPTSAIFVTDTSDEIANKVKRYAFSDGGDTIAEHRDKGALAHPPCWHACLQPTVRLRARTCCR